MSPWCSSSGELDVPMFSDKRSTVIPAFATRSDGLPVVGEMCAM